MQRSKFVPMIAGLLIAVFCLQWVYSASDSSHRLIVLKSNESAPYNEALEGFGQYLSEQRITVQLETYTVQTESVSAVQALSSASAAQTELVLCLGHGAVDLLLKEGRDLPVLAALVINTDVLAQASNATWVEVSFPPETSLEWLAKFLPESKKIGVLYDPAINEKTIKEAEFEAKRKGLQLYPEAIHSPRELPSALERLARRVEVLWGITDRTVYSPETAKSILLFSFRYQIPFVGLSLAWVKAGALYALDRDYSDLGRQCGEVAVRVLNGIPPGQIRPILPRKVVHHINLKTAKHFKLEFSPSAIEAARTAIR